MIFLPHMGWAPQILKAVYLYLAILLIEIRSKIEVLLEETKIAIFRKSMSTLGLLAPYVALKVSPVEECSSERYQSIVTFLHLLLSIALRSNFMCYI